MSGPAITVEGLSKVYRLNQRQQRSDSFREMLTSSLLSPLRRMRQLAGTDDSLEEFWALKDVSFEVQPGEVVGIIGRNGAGKSTLLKVLSRIVEPSAGEITLRGRVASLLEVGTGFHPELSGRENIYLNGSILGMKKREIDARFDEIVAFAEVEQFLDTPVKRYSSGMYVRLAFAVAAHLDPEILIVDEVLAVGDAEFQKKCLGKMKEVATGTGRTVLFVSHNMTAVRTLCDSGLVLVNGRVELQAETSEAVQRYVSLSSSDRSQSWNVNTRRSLDIPLAFVDASVRLDGQQPEHRLHCSVTLHSQGGHVPAFLAIDIHNSEGAWIMQAIPELKTFIPSKPGRFSIEVDVELPPMIPGTYPVSFWVGSSFSQTTDWLKECVEFTVKDSPSPGRTVGHDINRGYIVPRSSVTQITHSALSQVVRPASNKTPSI